MVIKMTISKIKKICSIALIPRILRDEFTLSTKKIGKRPLEGLWRMNKSTDSKDTEAECEKCKKLIEMVFGPDKPEHVIKQAEANLEDLHIEKKQKTIAPSVPLSDKSYETTEIGSDSFLSTDKAQKVLESIDNNLRPIKDQLDQKNILSDCSRLHFTTAKEEKEELAQKLEKIEEPTLVEATSPKIEGFNSPKVLGGRGNDSDKSLCMKVAPDEDPMDAIAKKCLGTPPDKIDERIMEELRSCGILGRGRRRPSTRRSRSQVHRANKKEPLMEAKPKECMLYFEKQQTPNSTFHAYPPLSYQSMKAIHNPENIYPSYFKNVAVDLTRGAELKEISLEKIVSINRNEENTALVPTDNRHTVNTYQKSNSAIEKVNNKTEAPNESHDSIVYVESLAKEEENPEEKVENIEVAEDMRISAAETSRLGIPGKSAVEIKEQTSIKREVLPCNQALRTTDIIADKIFVPDKRESHVAFSNPINPHDWHYAPALTENSFNQPNTAISGTYPPHDIQYEPKVKDTAISARQDPGEFYDLTHCNLQNLDDYAISPSAIRPLEAYHPYTILTSAELKESQNILYTTKETLNIPTPEELPKSENPDPSISKDISATMGPVPHLKDIEEEIPLTELLRRVRERNRLQYYKECEHRTLEAEPAEANRCNPPLDKSPQKPMGPGPCRPKTKPASPPPPRCPPPCPSPCPPPCKPKDPCAKFTKNSLIVDKIREAFTLVLQVGLNPASPALSYQSSLNAIEPLKLVSEGSSKIEKLSSFLLSNSPKRKELSGDEDVILVRDFEPWTPIPSWPIPKKEEKKPFVCPKEGCKVIPPPRLNPPCKENPCINLPKRSFSMADYELDALYLYEEDW